MPVPMLTAMASPFLKKVGEQARISKNFLFDYICQIWAFSLVLPSNIVEVVILHPSQVR